MDTSISNLYLDPWDFSVQGNKSAKNVYICVSGNSGVGKSTLINAVGEAIHNKYANTIVIDEKSLHHPFLPHLFFTPNAFAFELQLNFMIQRVLIVKHWISQGFNLIMERSHLEDVIFIRHLLNEGLVNKEEHDAYISVWSQLVNRMPQPDLILYINVKPELSLERLRLSEASGERPREFPDEITKGKWINSWYQLYVERIKELKEMNLQSTKLIVLDGTKNVNEVAHLALTNMNLST